MVTTKASMCDMEQISNLLNVWEEEEPDASITHDNIESYINDGMVYLYMADDDDAVLGIMVLSDSYKYINLSSLYVHPEHRGEGGGGELLASLINLLDDRCINAFLKVSSNNSAQFLYERFGFKEVKIFERDNFIGMERAYEQG